MLKLLGIPLAGISIPLISGLVKSNAVNSFQYILSLLFFILTSSIVWHGSLKIISGIRANNYLKDHIYLKLFAQLSISMLYGFVVVAILSALWQIIFLQPFLISPILRSSLLASITVIFFSFTYEILFLSKERELDNKIVNHLDEELKYSEINSLKNELNPHFVYNTLMPLYYLIKNDVSRAEAFIFKLMQVYQYFLENQHKDFISLREEIKFIEDYKFLLVVRYKDTINISIDVSEQHKELLILPSSLQILIENAIKHNEFDIYHPLEISISLVSSHLVVVNKIRERKEAKVSTKIGLKNLKERYRILTKHSIQVAQTNNNFIVKLPTVSNSRHYAFNNYNRR